MTGQAIAIDLLLAAAVALEIACALGVLLMGNALDRLHFVSLASLLGPIAITAAVWLRHGWGGPSGKVTLVLLLIVLTGPVLSHVTGRAAVRRTEARADADSRGGS